VGEIDQRDKESKVNYVGKRRGLNADDDEDLRWRELSLETLPL
jgi:hypothetical protein